MDLVVEHLLVEVHRCLSSFFPTRFSGWPTSYAAGMMPPYGAQGELRRIPLPETVWKLRIGSIKRYHEPAEYGEKAPFWVFRATNNREIDPFTDFPDSLSTLDFSHLLPKRVGHASRPSSRGGHFDAPIPERSSKLTTPRKNLSDAPLGPALVHTSFGHPYPAPRVRWALPGGKETFCGLPVRTDPKKGLRSTMEPSTYAVCQAAKWLKSSLEKLSENPHERANLLAIRRLIAA